MRVNLQKFKVELRNILFCNAEALFDFRLELMRLEIAEGWAYCYAFSLWLAETLPPPLINALGRTYECEQIKTSLYHGQNAVGMVDRYNSTFLDEFFSSENSRKGFRNFLGVGGLGETIANGKQTLWDLTANEAIKKLYLEENRDYWIEARDNREEWEFAQSVRCLRTPFFFCRKKIYDGTYGLMEYAPGLIVGGRVSDMEVDRKPDWHLKLMSEMTSDFVYSLELSTRTRLVFTDTKTSEVAWAIIIQKTDGSPDFRLPPFLVLIERQHGKKLKDEHIVYRNVIPCPIPYSGRGPRGIELLLIYYLKHVERIVEFYTPFILEAESVQKE